ncbi:hypothetical protein C5167_031419 [Papaver somniferum]|uniref:Transposase-associated domain-containing protein n=1 Tax=Papaver somniferum TaxID=3469 RepID=A0A4Y7K5R1_PAPSO|nr:hypothetical protein C5167_031419 [Papaver somniferum]
MLCELECRENWIFENNRFGKVYRHGVKFFIQFAATYGIWKTVCPCPCSRCLNGDSLIIKEVQQHLYLYGIDKTYVTWVFHGEKRPGNNAMSIPVEDVANDQIIEDAFPDLSPLIDAAFEVHERNSGGVCVDDVNGTQDGDEDPFEFEPDAQKRHEKYKKLAEQKLYPTCERKVSTLSAIVELQNIKKQFGISGNCVTKLLEMVKGWIPEENTLPSKYTEMKSIMMGLGMKYKAIHVTNEK